MPIDKLPSSTAIKRRIELTDAIFFNIHNDGSVSPIEVTQHGIRATQNNPGANENDEVGQIQETQTARTHPDCDQVAIVYSLLLNPLNAASQTISISDSADSKKAGASLGQQFRLLIDRFIKTELEQKTNLQEITLRIARNILSGRAYWRNLDWVDAGKVNLYKKERLSPASRLDTKQPWVQADLCLKNLQQPERFQNYNEDELMVADFLYDQLTGDSRSSLTVEAILEPRFSGVFEVFPSQNYLPDKKRGFARSLYFAPLSGQSVSADQHGHCQALGQAAFRASKVWNALRTFDTWYPNYDEVGYPIPIEPNGANLGDQIFYRLPKTAASKIEASSAYDLALRLDTLNEEQARYMLALLIRGGVLSRAKDKKK